MKIIKHIAPFFLFKPNRLICEVGKPDEAQTEQPVEAQVVPEAKDGKVYDDGTTKDATGEVRTAIGGALAPDVKTFDDLHDLSFLTCRGSSLCSKDQPFMNQYVFQGKITDRFVNLFEKVLTEVNNENELSIAVEGFFKKIAEMYGVEYSLVSEGFDVRIRNMGIVHDQELDLKQSSYEIYVQNKLLYTVYGDEDHKNIRFLSRNVEDMKAPEAILQEFISRVLSQKAKQ